MKLDTSDDLPNEPAATTDSDALIDRIQVIGETALEAGEPLELDPHRGKLFQVFAEAYHAQLTTEDAPLSSDELTRLLGQRWGLDESAKKSVASQQQMKEADLTRMRLLWSILRLWMEWQYAWDRWAEFGSDGRPKQPR